MFSTKGRHATIRTGGLFAAAFATLAMSASPSIPHTMRAIRADAGGAPGAVKVETVPVPQPAEGQVLLRVYAAGTNPVDWGIRVPPSASQAAGASPQRPAPPPGRDVAGVIIALGSGASGYKIGDKVYTALAGGGAYAEYAVAPAAELAIKPQKFTFEEAAGIPIAGYTGLRMVVMAKLKPGERVLIIGAAGGVGSTAVQAAHAAGAHVIAVASSRHDKYLEALGAHEIIDYDKQSVAEKAKAVAVVLNTVGTENANALSYVQPGGLVLDASGQVDEKACAAVKVTCIHVVRQGPTNAQLLMQLTQMADAGKYSVKVEKSFPLAKTGEALSYGRTGDREGKVIIDVHKDAKKS
ncbi:MAG TPA: NADP-dependent oxidoreductase [Steroidobacteraceae bacterium]|nr:NADP-dependent oxidoreductase [Steroidobacteraceae bacterium]